MSSQPTVKPQDLESVIGDLDGALAWLQTLGIQPDRTRFSEYRNTLHIVHKYRVAGKLKELPAIVPPEQYRVAFIESTQLIAVSKTPKLFSGTGVREKVRVAVTGPVSPSDEKKGRSNARDILFELSTAAFFRVRKIPGLIHTDKDIILRISGCTIFVECKRPKSVNGVERSIKAATKQLIAHFKNSSRRFMPRGLIVLDISTVMNPKRNVLTSDSLGAIAAEMERLLDRFLNHFRSALEHRRNQRILGILAFANVLGYHTPDSRHLNCQKLGLYFHAQPGSYEAILADDLYGVCCRSEC